MSAASRSGLIGEPVGRAGGESRVNGEQRYVADIHLPTELHAHLVTLPVAHARIVSIDATAALALPGVRMVFSAADVPESTPRFGPQFNDRPVIATGEIKYHGEPVAIVAAETKDAAEEAARLVHVEYEELPAVVTVADAIAEGAPLVQDAAIRPPNDPLANNERAARARHRLGRRQCRERGPGRREHVPLPDGHAFRDRATCVHRGA